MPLYEVAILQRPTKKEAEDGICETLVFGPTSVVAADEQGAVVSAVRKGTVSTDVDDSRLSVLVRPF